MNPSDTRNPRGWKPRGWRQATALVLVAAACVGVGRWLWGEALPSRPARIAVVNLARVWGDYQRKVHLDKELEQLGAVKEAAFQEKQGEVEQLQQKIELLAAGSAQRAAAEQELTEKRVELESLARISRQELQGKALEYMDEIYADIRAAVNDVAEQEGYDLVLKAAESRRRAKSIPEFQAKIETQVVLYSSAPMDLTDTVVALLNSRFAQTGAGKE